MLTRRTMLVLPAGIVACGGGGAEAACEPEGAIALYAHSVGTSYLITPNPAGIERLAIPFARSLQGAIGRPVLDYSASGATARGLLAGADRMSTGPFAEHVRTVPAGVVLIFLGGVEALFPKDLGHDPESFGLSLGSICDHAIKAGRMVALIDQYRLPGFESAVDAINAQIDAVAAARNIPVVRTRDLPVTTADGVHPDEPLKNAIVHRSVEQVRKIL